MTENCVAHKRFNHCGMSYNEALHSAAPNEVWAVSGITLDDRGNVSGGGILYWCCSHAYARDLRKEMLCYPWQFRNLKIVQYLSN